MVVDELLNEIYCLLYSGWFASQLYSLLTRRGHLSVDERVDLVVAFEFLDATPAITNELFHKIRRHHHCGRSWSKRLGDSLGSC